MSSIKNWLNDIIQFDTIKQKIKNKDIPIISKNLPPQFKAIDIKVHQAFIFAEAKIREVGDCLKDYVVKTLKEVKIEKTTELSPLSKLEDLSKVKGGSNKKGEIIFNEFVDYAGRKICREVATRAKTVGIYKSQLQSELSYLEDIKNRHSDVSDEMNNRIEYLKEKIKISNCYTGDWSSTNSPRMLFQKLGKEDAKELGLPILTNLRVHSVQFDHDSISANRSAAVSDFAHAETSLLEIKDYNFLQTLKWSSALPSEVINHYQIYYNVDIRNQGAYLDLIKQLQSHIESAYGTGKISHINEIENERRNCLRMQVLQDLVVHFKNKPVDSPTAFYSRISILDPTKKPAPDKKTGYYISEKNELMDMKAIYDELDGVEVLFDLANTDGPFFDPEGRIHMPSACCNESIANNSLSVTLNTALFSSSVQNNQANKGIQLQINLENFNKLKLMELTNEQRSLLEYTEDKLLYKSKTSFTQAHRLLEFGRSLGYCSVDCYGGKDRTGYDMALETYYAIRQKMRQKIKDSGKADPRLKKNYHKMMSAIRKKLVGPSGVANQGVEDNTGSKVMKISGFNLKLYLSGRGIYFLEGIGRRLSDYLKQATIFIPEPFVIQPTHHDESILFDQSSEIEALKQNLKKAA